MTQEEIKNVRDNVKNILKKKWTIYINEDWGKTIIQLCDIAEQSHKLGVSGKQPFCQCGQNSLPYDAIHKVKTCSRCGAACDHAKGG